MNLYPGDLEIETIKSISQIPNDVRTRFSYKKQLSATDWYREIRHRQFYKSHIEFIYAKFPPKTIPGGGFEIFDRLHEDYENLENPLSVANYYLDHWNKPVSDLTLHEAAYLACGVRQSGNEKIIDDLDLLLRQWDTARQDKVETFIESPYKDLVEVYVDTVFESEVNYEAPALAFTLELGNPFLSFGQPLNGLPITVDTQFDDETLVHGFRDWLRTRRAQDKEKVRRPFNQNDFDDWAHYKVRELFDLEIWAALRNVKILDRVVAEYLWPNPLENFSPIDVLRTTTRKKAKEVFSFSVCLRLYSQLRLELGENFLD